MKNNPTCTTLALLALISFAAGQTPSEPNDADLAQYFGFAEMEILKLQNGISKPIVADLNQDGLNDIIVVNNRKARIELLLQKKGFQPGSDVSFEPDDEDINDIFGKESNWRFKRISYPLDVSAESLVVADLNNDDRMDLAFYAKEGLFIVLQDKPDTGAEADAAFGPQPHWRPRRKIDIRGGLSNPLALGAGDINHDHKTDLALLAADGVFLLRQQDDGTFPEPVKYHSSSNRLKQIDIADLNGDGRNDLVLLTATHEEYPLRIRFQTGDGGLGPEIRYRLPVPTVLELAALAGLDRRDIFSVSYKGGRVLVSTLDDQPQGEELAVNTLPLPATLNADKRDTVAADLDGDGLLDLVVSDPTRAEFLLFRAHADTALTTLETYPGLKDMRKLVAGDLNGQGRASIVVLSVEEKLIALSKLDIGTGRLTFPTTVPIVGDPQAMDLADIDNDGQLDLIYVARQDDPNDEDTDKFFLRTVLSIGRDAAAPGPSLELKEIKDRPLDLRAADIDHDGRTDIMLVRSYADEPLLLIRQSEPGVFAEETSDDIHSGLVTQVYPRSLGFAPLGPDGSMAALLVRKNFARALCFGSEQGWHVIDQYPAPDPQSSLTVALGTQLTPGQALNIVAHDSARSKVAILSRRDDGTYRTIRQIDIGSLSAQKILSGNFGGQSPTSLLLCGSNKIILVPIRDGARQLRQFASFEPDIKGGRFGALSVGDINSDGSPEIILCEQARHHLQILSFNDQGELVSACKFKVFEQPRGEQGSRYREGRGPTSGEPRAVTLADVTNDGKTDLILQVHDRIIIYPQD